MPETIKIVAYRFEELSDAAKEKLRVGSARSLQAMRSHP